MKVWSFLPALALSYGLAMRAWSFTNTRELWAQAKSLLDSAKDQEVTGNLIGAEHNCLQALVIAKQLPANEYRVQSDVLQALGNVYEKEGKTSEAEVVYKERLDLLIARQKGIDLAVGNALFELESLYEATGREQQGSEFYARASDFYQYCKTDAKRRGDASLASACDRRLADVQGIRGASLFEHKHPEEAESILRMVVGRSDDQVRPENLEAALMALTAICLQHGSTGEAKALALRAWQLRTKYPEARNVPWPDPFNPLVRP